MPRGIPNGHSPTDEPKVFLPSHLRGKKKEAAARIARDLDDGPLPDLRGKIPRIGDDLEERITIGAPRLLQLQVVLLSTTPLMVNRFSAKAIEMMSSKQQAGPTAGKGRQREAKDFDAAFHGARHLSEEGWDGVAAGGLRAAMISACRLVGFKMTLAKLAVFVEADGFDIVDGTPLIRIYSYGGDGDAKPSRQAVSGPLETPVLLPEKSIMHARNETGVADIRIRPMWRKWSLRPRIRYDADQFTATDVSNLLSRVGQQVGLGEGRHDSRKSTGLGFGCFELRTGKN